MSKHLAGCRFSHRVTGSNPRPFRARSVGVDQNNVTQVHGHYLDDAGQPLAEVITAQARDLINPVTMLPGDMIIAEFNRVRALWRVQANGLAKPILGGGKRPQPAAKLNRVAYPATTDEAFSAQVIYQSFLGSDRNTLSGFYQWAGFWTPTLAESLRTDPSRAGFLETLLKRYVMHSRLVLPYNNLAWISGLLHTFDPPTAG